MKSLFNHLYNRFVIVVGNCTLTQYMYQSHFLLVTARGSLRKQTDFPPVALLLLVFFGGAKQQAENPSVFAGYARGGVPFLF